MASGEPRFLVLNKPEDWQRGCHANLAISDLGLSISTMTEYTKEKEIVLTDGVEKGSFSEFVVGRCGLLFVLDPEGCHLGLYDLNLEKCECIGCIGKLLSRPVAIACTPRTLYVADVQSPKRIIAFARLNWQIRWVIGPSPASSDGPARHLSGGKLSLDGFAPTCLGVGEDESLYALDAANSLVAKFDASGELVDCFIVEVSRRPRFTALALAPGSVLYLLDTRNRTVVRLDLRTRETNESFIDLAKLDFPIQPSSLAVDKQGMLYIGDDRPESKKDEDDRFIRIFAPDGTYRGTVTGYRGAVTKLAIDARGRIVVLDSEGRRLTVLALVRKLSMLEDQSLPGGVFFSKALDSAQIGTLWHKIVIDADVPPNTQIQVYYHSADEIGEFGRAVEATDVTAPQKRLLAWSGPILNPRDALLVDGAKLQPPQGRYLWLRLEILGSREETPVVRSVRVYFPRTSYLRYLPSIYREESANRGFLERYLSLFETCLAGSESEIERIVRLFDVDAVPSAFLDWLASWLAMQLDDVWGEGRRRALLKKAPELFATRGTRVGIGSMIEILTGERPCLVEQFQLYRFPVSEEFKQVLERLFGKDPYCFTVLLKQNQVKSDEQRKALQRLLSTEKPAHTCANLEVLEPWIFLDWHTYLGVNTYLSKPTIRLDGDSVMPRDTLLSDEPEAGQMERRSRVELDTELT